MTILLLDRPFSEIQLAESKELDLRNVGAMVWPTVLSICRASNLRLYHLIMPSLEGIERLVSTIATALVCNQLPIYMCVTRRNCHCSEDIRNTYFIEINLNLQTLAFAALIIELAVFSPLAAGADPAWDPSRTWVFAVGLVEWESPTYSSFPKKNRQDVELINTLNRRGVPESQIVFLKDKQATTKRITEEFEQFVRRPQPGDWLFLYVSGHGFNSTNHRQTYFASYDADGKNIGVRLGWFLEIAEKQFQGRCVMIAADHCCSGGIAESVNAMQPSKSKYAVFCSAHVNSKSTGNWTFTEGLISGFQGRRWMDDDGDGSVTFRELAVNLVEDMAFAEDQMAQFTLSSSLDRNTQLAKANTEPAPQVGDRVEILSEGQWYRGLILNRNGERLRVHYYGWPKSDDEWVTEDRIRRAEKKTVPVGTKVQVLSSGKWYEAEVVAARLGLHFVKFDGWDPEWNEWVPFEKMRLMGERTK